MKRTVIFKIVSVLCIALLVAVPTLMNRAAASVPTNDSCAAHSHAMTSAEATQTSGGFIIALMVGIMVLDGVLIAALIGYAGSQGGGCGCGGCSCGC